METPASGNDRDLQIAKDFVKGKIDTIPGEKKYGVLSTFSEAERQQLSSLQKLVCDYLDRRSPRRPLCLALFGPPGSGKSLAAKQIRLQVLKSLGEANHIKLPITVVNMTQVPEPAEVAKTLSRIASEQDDETVPFVFFDEFDGSLAGVPLGWLAWFLAPMNDGEFLHDGTVTRLKRAVYVFAGGTCSQMLEFAERHGHDEKVFVAAKGPDFVSRLRGYGDILGPNAPPRALRRAVTLRFELGERKTPKGDDPSLEDELLTELLAVGRYRHGARSIGAVLDMSHIVDGKPLGFADLPEAHLLALHVDRGPLDPRRIGGCIAITGSLSDAPLRKTFDAVWKRNAHVLWQHGATIAYGGRWHDGDAPSPVDMLSVEAKALPLGFDRTKRDIRVRNFQAEWVGIEPHPPQPPPDLVSTERVRGIEPTEEADFVDFDAEAGIRARTAVNLFRMRLQMEEVSVARIVVGGKGGTFSGRFSGVAEETALALALGHPIYVLGAAGGVATLLGELLGLKRPWTAKRQLSLADNLSEGSLSELRKISGKLRPPPWGDALPVTPADLLDFFREHAVGGPRWPDNGLTGDKNRELFASNDPENISSLVIEGLLNCLARK